MSVGAAYGSGRPAARAGRDGAPPAFVLAGAGLILVPCLLFLGARLGLPGDGTRVVERLPPPGVDGLYVAPLQPGRGALQVGDVVLAVAGQPVGERLRALLGPPALAPAAAFGSAVEYTVARDTRLQTVPVTLARYPLGAALARDWSSYVFLVYLEAVSVFVFVRRPRLAAAQMLFLVSSAIFSSSVTFFLGLQASDLLWGWPAALWLWGSIGLFGLLLGGLLHFALLFPRRRPARERRPWLIAPVYLAVWAPFAAFLGLGWAGAQTAAARIILAVQATTPMTALYFTLVLAVSAQGYLAAGSEVERRQVRWVLFGLVVSTVPWLGLSVFPALLGAPYQVDGQWVGLLRCAVPTTIAIAVLRERLFDIDRLINRALVYGALTAVLAAVYLAGVVSLQRLFRIATGQESQLAVVASTLAIAALFAPLRRRVQDFIDRRFYRRRYDAAQTLAEFARTARDETDVDTLAGRLVGVVEETMQPAHVSLWLRQVAGERRPARSGE